MQPTLTRARGASTAHERKGETSSSRRFAGSAEDEGLWTGRHAVRAESATGELAGVADMSEGFALVQRMGVRI